ncbi:S1/P1 nuclease [Salinimicrobium sp. GXAS 041]|uniref:S1/P1 nuclease n=1 Tax=Salinimicrobium sp. GXAS 041 TaxID=3400806 RepID=UPI003C7299C8
MKNLFLVVAILISSFSFASEEDWGRTGHRATGEIAQQYLSKKAKKKINEILDGESLALVSTFADDIKSDPRYREFNPWHYVNLEKGETEYSKEKANPAGDLVQAIKKSISVLEDEKSSKEDKAFYLKMLVHFIGDLHQPFHAGRGEDKGGNDIQVRWFGDGSNIHRVWDSEMINDFQMSYTELAENAEDLSKSEVKEIASGTILDWMYESKELSKKTYASVEIGEKLGYEYMYEWFPVVREQLQKGGIRLATVLNEALK